MHFEVSLKIAKRLSLACVAGSALFGATAVWADVGRFLNAPSSAVRPTPELAVQLELKIRLPEGRGLARLLLDSGVTQADAAAAARLAAGHLGDGANGCSARIAVSRLAGSAGFRLERVTLYTDAAQTVIERREGELAIASQKANRQGLRLI